MASDSLCVLALDGADRELVEAFIEHADERSGLTVLGAPKDGTMGDAIREIAITDARVGVRLEYVPDDELALYLERADVAVLPYKHIFNSGSIVHAMSAGVACLLPDLETTRAIAGDHNIYYDDLVQGLLVAEALDAEHIDAIGERNSEFAETRHAWDRVVDGHRELYGIE